MCDEANAIKQLERISKNLASIGETEDYTEVAILAIENSQRYQALTTRLNNMFGGAVSLQMVVNALEDRLREPNNPRPMNAKILTYEDSEMWEQYKAIGTVEEIQAALNRANSDIEPSKR